MFQERHWQRHLQVHWLNKFGYRCILVFAMARTSPWQRDISVYPTDFVNVVTYGAVVMLFVIVEHTGKKGKIGLKSNQLFSSSLEAAVS